MTPDGILTLLAIAIEAYPGRMTTSGETESVWADGLSDLSDEAGLKAVRAWVRTEEWPPTIAGIRRIDRDASGTPASEAWEMALKALRDRDYEKAPACPDPLVQKTLMAFGWQNLEDKTNRETKRAQFLRMYEEIRDVAELREETGPALSDGSRSGMIDMGSMRDIVRND